MDQSNEPERPSPVTPAPGDPAQVAPEQAAPPAAPEKKDAKAKGDSPHVESKTPENRTKRINPSPEDVNSSASTRLEK